MIETLTLAVAMPIRRFQVLSGLAETYVELPRAIREVD